MKSKITFTVFLTHDYVIIYINTCLFGLTFPMINLSESIKLSQRERERETDRELNHEQCNEPLRKGAIVAA